MKIKTITGRVIQDSSGQDALEAEVVLENGIKAISSVGQGRSRGSKEKAQDAPGRAIKIIEDKIEPRLAGISILSQAEIDKILEQNHIGVNTSLAVSQAVAQTGAKIKKMPLWQYLTEKFELEKPQLPPCPLVVVVEGAKHNPYNEKPEIQEYLVGGDLEMARKIYAKLKEFFENEKVKYETGFEGALAPKSSDDLKILDQFKKLKVDFDFKLGVDLAAESDPKISRLTNQIISQYPLDMLEDPFTPLEAGKWRDLCKNFCDRKIIIGDDLTVTDSQKIQSAAQRQLINGVIIKPNQAGSVTATFEAVKAAKQNNLKIIVSHRSRETKDDILADIALAAGADYLKAGYPSQEERKVKWERLKKIKSEAQNPE